MVLCHLLVLLDGRELLTNFIFALKFLLSKWLYLGKIIVELQKMSYFSRNNVPWNLNKSYNFSKFQKLCLKILLSWDYIGVKWVNNWYFLKNLNFVGHILTLEKFSTKRHFLKIVSPTSNSFFWWEVSSWHNISSTCFPCNTPY